MLLPVEARQGPCGEGEQEQADRLGHQQQPQEARALRDVVVGGAGGPVVERIGALQCGPGEQRVAGGRRRSPSGS